ncbi:hypothetical protein GOODEAATRI_017300 [Goodea atripinnis]|uniref:Uncharacterized protein n=1 Tax=Goodea atripinnis TaxID=208336 RepID=A0ABV0NVD0_9TELE
MRTEKKSALNALPSGFTSLRKGADWTGAPANWSPEVPGPQITGAQTSLAAGYFKLNGPLRSALLTIINISKYTSVSTKISPNFLRDRFNFWFHALPVSLLHLPAAGTCGLTEQGENAAELNDEPRGPVRTDPSRCCWLIFDQISEAFRRKTKQCMASPLLLSSSQPQGSGRITQSGHRGFH